MDSGDRYYFNREESHRERTAPDRLSTIALDLSEVNVTDTGLAELRKALPKCEISR